MSPVRESGISWRARAVHRAGLSLAWLLALVSCSGGGGASEQRHAATRVAIVTREAGGEGAALALARATGLLAQASGHAVEVVDDVAKVPSDADFILAVGDGELADRVLDGTKPADLPASAYRMARGEEDGRPVLAARGADALGAQYAIYALLEALGFGFFHPEQTFVPARLVVPEVLDETHQPTYAWRGFHLHTMHPIELMDSFLLESDAHLAEAERYLDWLIANRQTYVQWVLQDTVDIDAFLRHASRIVAAAHTRGLKVGIDTPFQFNQQNGWVLVPDGKAPGEPQIEQRIAKLMQVPWDVINVELGNAEFLPSDDQATYDWLNFTAALLDERYGAELLSKVHITSGQTAPHFGGINFNFLPGIADPRVGVMPHSVQFYDLFRPAPTYDNADFSALRTFLLGEIGERRVLYYPETAYWVTFDVDVPLFLPHYGYSRWNDLQRLADSGMDGQIDFSSGFEWGFWLNDWMTASSVYEAREDWRVKLARFTRIFGKRAEAMQDLLVRVIDEQGADLLEGNAIAELIGWDSADDIGHFIAGTEFQPVRLLPEEIRALDADGLAAYEADVIARLTTLDATYAGFAAEIGRLAGGIPADARPWFDELRDGLEITRLRIRHVLLLDRGLVAIRRAALGLDPGGDADGRALWRDAQATRLDALEIVSRREAAYRFPVERIARRRENPTSYEFGYLFTVWDLYYWKRDEARAFADRFCICDGNLVNLVDNFLGEGGLGDVLEALPPLPGCLDTCAHPVDVLADPVVPGP